MMFRGVCGCMEAPLAMVGMLLECNNCIQSAEEKWRRGEREHYVEGSGVMSYPLVLVLFLYLLRFRSVRKKPSLGFFSFRLLGLAFK
jgi:hypothetical protein